MPSARRPETRQVNLRLPVPICVRLEAAAAVLGKPHTQASIVADALEAYLNALPAKDRQLIDTILARRQKQ